MSVDRHTIRESQIRREPPYAVGGADAVSNETLRRRNQEPASTEVRHPIYLKRLMRVQATHFSPAQIDVSFERAIRD